MGRGRVCVGGLVLPAEPYSRMWLNYETVHDENKNVTVCDE